MSAELLILTLRGCGEALAGLRAVLTPAADQLFVYYICPLRNLRGIAATGILSSASAPKDKADLSGQSVQARRNMEMNLAGWKQANLHQCVNLFWNPLNSTMRAFQQNGLLLEASSKNPDDAVVCVLEISLERLVLDPRCNWAIAPQNLARNEFHTFASEQLTGQAKWEDGTPRCDWKSIFSIQSAADQALDWQKQARLNGKRSAELIVHLGDNAEGTSSIALPFEMIDRIIVPAEQIRKLTDEQNAFLSSTGKVITRLSKVNDIQVYFSKEELLKPVNDFLKSLAWRSAKDLHVLEKINAALNALLAFEKEHPELSPARERFLQPELADSHHGLTHAVRVMFWSAFLVQHLDEAVRAELMPAVLVAASLHDTFREKEDETHGKLAADAHSPRIAKFFGDPKLPDSCLNAIQYHCVPDAGCPKLDLVLQILKDADALDRGRFGGPNYQKGCDTKFLRADVLKTHDPKNNIAWMAFQVAQITRHSPMGLTPCADFTRALCDAVKSLSKK